MCTYLSPQGSNRGIHGRKKILNQVIDEVKVHIEDIDNAGQNNTMGILTRSKHSNRRRYKIYKT